MRGMQTWKRKRGLRLAEKAIVHPPPAKMSAHARSIPSLRVQAVSDAVNALLLRIHLNPTSMPLSCMLDAISRLCLLLFPEIIDRFCAIFHSCGGQNYCGTFGLHRYADDGHVPEANMWLQAVQCGLLLYTRFTSPSSRSSQETATKPLWASLNDRFLRFHLAPALNYARSFHDDIESPLRFVRLG